MDAALEEEEETMAAVPEIEETLAAVAEEDDGIMRKDVKGSPLIEMLEDKDIALMEFKDNGSPLFDISGELMLQLTKKESYLESFIDFYISRLRRKMNSNPKYDQAIFLSPKAYRSFMDNDGDFKKFWISKLLKDYHESVYGWPISFSVALVIVAGPSLVGGELLLLEALVGPRQRGCNADNQKWLAREHICVAAADENHLFIGTAGVPIASLFRVSCLLTTKQSKVCGMIHSRMLTILCTCWEERFTKTTPTVDGTGRIDWHRWDNENTDSESEKMAKIKGFF
ncbi:hypothetical protein MKW98_008234 [Papaver atlanticum]|uniref:Uncharacterized protein n=1 Tax=Papaver atlanticum TaxID=357466 RepID=A0AAD4RW42_9MAGN|nr:hypothetical protein MKW98_008234 [Papaver atlanticum]